MSWKRVNPPKEKKTCQLIIYINFRPMLINYSHSKFTLFAAFQHSHQQHVTTGHTHRKLSSKHRKRANKITLDRLQKAHETCSCRKQLQNTHTHTHTKTAAGDGEQDLVKFFRGEGRGRKLDSIKVLVKKFRTTSKQQVNWLGHSRH